MGKPSGDQRMSDKAHKNLHAKLIFLTGLIVLALLQLEAGAQ
jgi:hypothetical protein